MEVRAVAEDSEGTIWVGTMRSLECIRNGVSQPIELPGEWFETKDTGLAAGAGRVDVGRHGAGLDSLVQG